MCMPFDLPSLFENNEIMQSRQLWQFNMLIHDEIRQRTHVYTWPECVASKGSSEITSCIRKHLKENIPAQTEKIILYCDPLSGQNRNMKISLMLKHLLNSWPHNNLKTIEQRFFLKGHAKNKCNVDFGLIEKRKKIVQNIFVPNDCVKVIKESKSTDPKFFVLGALVTAMQSQDFFSLDPLLNLLDENLKHLALSNVQTIVHNRNEPFKIKFKNYGSAKSKEIPCKLRSNNVESFPVVDLPVRFAKGRAISRSKYDDLQDLAKYIPTEYQDFYKKLKFEATMDVKDYALSFKESSDEED